MINEFSENGIIIPENLMKKDIDETILKKLKTPKETILFKTESDFHNICVCKNKLGQFLKYGISIQAGIIDTKDYKGNIPYLNYFLQTSFLKKDAKKILLIGFGSGLLVNQLEKLFTNLKKFDVVDIEENILEIAKNYFNFKENENFNFYLQDALVFLKNNKTKYDVIITDVAGNEGIDERFFSDEFFENIKKSLSKNGIFAFNNVANIDFDENKKTFFGYSINKYKEFFKNIAVFNGKTSDMTTFKSLYNINERVFDVTNSIFIASDMTLTKEMFDISQKDIEKINTLNVNILPYTKDLHKIY
ncbi:MAG: fused MFS/spermidine synthase [bacterium]|nr:fused MFS/spermidine synthase [bacterium]